MCQPVWDGESTLKDTSVGFGPYLCFFQEKKSPASYVCLPTGLPSQSASHSTGFCFTCSFVSSCKPVLCLLRRQIHFVSSTASWNGEKEQKKIKVRICQGAGARGGKGGCPELWEARGNKAEAASCREIWEESM